MIQKAISLFILLLLFSIISCKDTAFQHPSGGVFSGNVTTASGLPVYPFYITEVDSLLRIVKKNNMFSIELEEGEHEIVFSAIGYIDKIVHIQVNGNINSEIKLEVNKVSGRIYGEFQDLKLFQQKVSENKELAKWSAKQIMDGVTGATIMENNFSTNFEQAQVYIGDSLLSYADVYGQYWFEIQCGTYPITGKSAGFSSETKVIKVLPDVKVYLNFFLEGK
jgi:hypothetical protein